LKTFLPHKLPIKLKLQPLWSLIGYSLIALVVWLSLTPHLPSTGFSISDKIMHFAAYGGLMGWFSQWHETKKYPQLALGFIVLGIALEYMQVELGYRFWELEDMLANSLGVGAAWILARYTFLGKILPRM
jgi:VanZ family protein